MEVLKMVSGLVKFTLVYVLGLWSVDFLFTFTRSVQDCYYKSYTRIRIVHNLNSWLIIDIQVVNISCTCSTEGAFHPTKDSMIKIVMDSSRP